MRGGEKEGLGAGKGATFFQVWVDGMSLKLSRLGR